MAPNGGDGGPVLLICFGYPPWLMTFRMHWNVPQLSVKWLRWKSAPWNLRLLFRAEERVGFSLCCPKQGDKVHQALACKQEGLGGNAGAVPFLLTVVAKKDLSCFWFEWFENDLIYCVKKWIWETCHLCQYDWTLEEKQRRFATVPTFITITSSWTWIASYLTLFCFLFLVFIKHFLWGRKTLEAQPLSLQSAGAHSGTFVLNKEGNCKEFQV